MNGEYDNILSNYFICNHRGGLYESMRTERCITKVTFEKLIKIGLYTFYGYDERINSDVYILEDMSHNLGLPCWLHYSKVERYCGFYDDSSYKDYK